MFRRRGQPYITYYRLVIKLSNFMIPKNYGFWRFLTPEYQGKIYQPPELATGVSVTFLK